MGRGDEADCRRYHHLNHYAIFGGGYKGGAIAIMKELVRKYG
jgi:protein-ribulosamine 3-kinase